MEDEKMYIGGSAKERENNIIIKETLILTLQDENVPIEWKNCYSYLLLNIILLNSLKIA